MELPGTHLKTQRESRHLSLKEVSLSTKIPEHVLKALEEDQYAILDSPTYVKGFLKSYAKYLGLEPGEIIPKYQNYLEEIFPSRKEAPRQQAIFQNLRQPILLPKKSIKFWILVLSCFVIVLLVAFVMYRNFRSVPAAKKEAPAVKQPMSAQPKAAVVAESPEIEVTDLGLGTGIQRKDNFLTLVGKRLRFRCNGQRVYLLSRIKARKEGKIIHAWRRNGEEFYRRELEIKPQEWSVYSYVILTAGLGGDWKAEVRQSQEDKVLAELSFRAIEPSSSSNHKMP